MADISTEPSMEEILSSIKRIIAEEGETPPRTRRPARGAAAATTPREADSQDEVLELSDPMPTPAEAAVKASPAPTATPPATEPAPLNPEAALPARPPMPRPAPTPPAEPLVSAQAAEASRAPLEVLSRLLVKPDPTSDGTLEGLVRELLRPMLREWLDANLPDLVETVVAREIAKLTREAR